MVRHRPSVSRVGQLGQRGLPGFREGSVAPSTRGVAVDEAPYPARAAARSSEVRRVRS